MSIGRHSVYNLVGAVTPVVVTVVTVPTYLDRIGEERYGVLVVLWATVGYLGLFDLGLGQAAANRIAVLRGASAESRAAVFWTALCGAAVLGCVAGGILWVGGRWALRVLVDGADGVGAEVADALPWLACSVPVLLCSSVLSGALVAREEFLRKNVIGAVEGVLIQVVPLGAAAWWSPDVSVLVASVLAVRVGSSAGLFWVCARVLRLRPRPVVAWDELRSLFAYGGWVTVSGIIGPVLSTVDRMLIGFLSGASNVTYYSVPFNIASKINMLPVSLASALFPRVSAANEREAEGLLAAAVRGLTLIVTPISACGIVAVRPVLTVWLGGEFAERAAWVGEILLVGLWANSLARVPFAYLQARGRPDLTAKFHLVEVGPYLVLLWFCVDWFGLVGAAVAWSARVWSDGVLLFWASGFGQARALVTPMVIVLSAIGVAGLAGEMDVAGQAVARCAFGVLVCAWSWRAMPSEVRLRIRRVVSFGRRRG